MYSQITLKKPAHICGKICGNLRENICKKHEKNSPSLESEHLPLRVSAGGVAVVDFRQDIFP
jgi:hypothetical protein